LSSVLWYYTHESIICVKLWSWHTYEMHSVFYGKSGVTLMQLEHACFQQNFSFFWRKHQNFSPNHSGSSLKGNAFDNWVVGQSQAHSSQMCTYLRTFQGSSVNNPCDDRSAETTRDLFDNTHLTYEESLHPSYRIVSTSIAFGSRCDRLLSRLLMSSSTEGWRKTN
jgi:hypothetical protein